MEKKQTKPKKGGKTTVVTQRFLQIPEEIKEVLNHCSLRDERKEESFSQELKKVMKRSERHIWQVCIPTWRESDQNKASQLAKRGDKKQK